MADNAMNDIRLWMHPYPTLVKYRGRRLNPTAYPFGRIFNDGSEFVRLSDLFEARKQTPPQLKRCVRAVAKQYAEGGKVTREIMSKAFAICTKQLQKSGYIKIGTAVPTRKGKKAGRSKAADKSHSGKVAEYEKMLAQARGESIGESGPTAMNVSNYPLDSAKEYARSVFKKAGKDLDKDIPNFDVNYEALQAKTKLAIDVPRIDMPVIEPHDMAGFDKSLKSGSIDVFEPYARGKLFAPRDLNTKKGEEWIKLGFADGKMSDDIIRGTWTRISASELKPTQSQIWLEKIVRDLAKYGIPGAGSNALDMTIIVSKDGYILDGHHRYGQVMLADPSLKMKALFIPLPIDVLLSIGRSYGNAIGNQQKG
jgi:hypothetical protein